MLHTEGRTFTRAEWKEWVEELHEEHLNVIPTDDFLEDQADIYEGILRDVGTDVLAHAVEEADTGPEEGEMAALVPSGKGPITYGIKKGNTFEMVKLDGLRIPHATGKSETANGRKVCRTAMWKGRGSARVIGPAHMSFPHPKGWRMGDTEVELDKLTIKIMTRTLTKPKFKRPPSEETWKERGIYGVKDTWKQTRLFASPRDVTTSLKMLHRNLYVANRGGMADTRCVTGCGEEESMLHLAECGRWRRHVWRPIFDLINKVGGKQHAISAELLITGRTVERKMIGQSHWDLIRITWRCIYAEMQKVRMEGTRLNMSRAYARAVRLFYGRVKAYAEKWRLWVVRNRHTSNKHVVPQKHRNKVYMKHAANGTYTINDDLQGARESIVMRGNRSV